MLNPWWIALLSGLAAGAMFAAYRLMVGRRMDQAFRDMGPLDHRKKGRIPTGTGIVFVLLLLIGGALALPQLDLARPNTALGIIVCWAAAAAGLLGFID